MGNEIKHIYQPANSKSPDQFLYSHKQSNSRETPQKISHISEFKVITSNNILYVDIIQSIKLVKEIGIVTLRSILADFRPSPSVSETSKPTLKSGYVDLNTRIIMYNND